MPAQLLLCLIMCLPIHAFAKQEALPPACSKSLSERLPGWRLAQPSAEAAAWAASQGVNPVVTAGDFNGDGRRDWAALVTANGSTVVAACLSQGRRVRIMLIDNVCEDMLTRAPAGNRRPNLDTDRSETLRHNAIATTCFEKAGQTHVYERGAFRSFTHAD